MQNTNRTYRASRASHSNGLGGRNGSGRRSGGYGRSSYGTSVGTIGNVAGLDGGGRGGRNGRGGLGGSGGRSPYGSHGSPGGRGSGHRGNGAGPAITRRKLLIGAGVAAGAAAVGGAAFAAKSILSNDDEQEETPVLNLPASSVVSSSTYEEQDAGSCAVLFSQHQLPYGTMVWSSCADIAACLVPNEDTEGAITQVMLWSLPYGTEATVLERAVDHTQGFIILDVRASARAIVWVESNILQGVWRVYTATVDGISIGSPVLAEEGSCDNWETPSLAAVGAFAYWQRLPNLEGPYSTEASTLRKARAGSSTFDVVATSTGRMATTPYALEDGVVICPRASKEGVYYEPTLLDAETDAVRDAICMPQNMKPAEVGYGKNGFLIAMGAIYDYGDGLSNLGSYTPTTKPADAAAYSTVPWLTFTRQPTAAPCWCGAWFIVKSTTAVCGFDPAGARSFVLDTQSGSEDWGDYLATTGICSTFVTYAHVDYEPMNSGTVDEDGQVLGETEEAMYCTLARAWQVVS